MWGGFDLGNISQFGNQLGEVLQRAKHEIDNKLDQTFAFDDKPAARSSDPANDDGDDFTVDANGLFIPTGRAAYKHPATTQETSTSTEQQQQATADAAASTTSTPTEQNGHAQQLIEADALQHTPLDADTASHASAVTAVGTQQPSSKQQKRKVVRKVVRKAAPDVDDSAADSPQPELAGADPGSIGSNSGSSTDAPDQAAAESTDVPAAAAADADDVPEAQRQQQQQSRAKQRKGLGDLKLGSQQHGLQQEHQFSEHHHQQQIHQVALPQQPSAQQQVVVPSPSLPEAPAHQQQQQQEEEEDSTAPSQSDAAAVEQPQQQCLQAQDLQLTHVEQHDSSSSDTPAVVTAAVPSRDQQQVAALMQQPEEGWEQDADVFQSDLPADAVTQESNVDSQQQPSQEHEAQLFQEQELPDSDAGTGGETADSMPVQAVDQPQQQRQPLDLGQQQHQSDQQHEQQQHDHLISLLKQQCHDLQQQLQQRESQLTRQAQRLGDLEAATSALSDSKAQLEQVLAALTAKNEQLVLRASRVNESELEEVQKEAAERLAAAERKVFALIKERDALKRAAAGSGDGSNDVKRLETDLRKKEELVTQLMDEGQKLSKRQMDLESAIKKLRQQLKSSETELEKLNALLAAERAESESLRRAKTKAERDLVAAVESGRQEVEAVRQQGEEQLLKAHADKATAEASAAEAAAEGLAGQLQASEARAAALAESVGELQEALDRHRATADSREEALRQELSDLERRAQAAVLRHQELSAKLPEATAPLLRQITALQDAAAAQAQAWTAAEHSLVTRVHEAEAAAAEAADREAEAQERLMALQARLSAAEQAAAAAKSSAAEAAARAARASERLALTEQQLEDAQAAAEEVQAVAAQLRDDLKQQEAAYKRKLSNESAARRAAEEELARTRQELLQLQGMVGPDVGGLGSMQNPGVSQPPDQQQSDMWRAAAAGPPALAAPGFKWILVREGADGPAAAAAANGDDAASSLPGTPHSATSAGAAGSKLLGQGSSASSAIAAAGFFDTSELLHSNSDAASISGAAAALGAASVGTPLSPTGSGALRLHQMQLRAVQQRLGGGNVREAQLQRLRAALRQKVGECAALEARVRELEETRDQLAGELVRATQDAKQASDAVVELPKLEQIVRELEVRYAAAVELVGERDEQLEELANDLEDVKQLYRQQIEALLAQMAQSD